MIFLYLLCGFIASLIVLKIYTIKEGKSAEYLDKGFIPVVIVCTAFGFLSFILIGILAIYWKVDNLLDNKKIRNPFYKR